MTPAPPFSGEAPRVRVLGPGDEPALARVAPGVFDPPVQPELAREFLNDLRHHLAVALDGDRVVGMASALHYLHPDKPAELWINEVGVAPSHRRRGLGRELLRALLAHGRTLGCREAWVLTDRRNAAALRLYAALGGRESGDDTVAYAFALGPVSPGDAPGAGRHGGAT